MSSQLWIAGIGRLLVNTWDVCMVLTSEEGFVAI